MNIIRHLYKRRKHVALLLPNMNYILRQIHAGLVNTLEQNVDVDFTFINGKDDLQYMRTMVNALLDENVYDLFFSLGKSFLV